MEGLVVGEATADLGRVDIDMDMGTMVGVGGTDSGVSVGWIWPRRWRCGGGEVTASGGGLMSTGSGGIRVGVGVGAVSGGLIFTCQRHAPPFS